MGDIGSADEVDLQRLVLGPERRPVDIAATNESLRRLRGADLVRVGKWIGRPEGIDRPRCRRRLVIEIQECGVYEKTSYGLLPLLSFPEMPRRVTELA